MRTLFASTIGTFLRTSKCSSTALSPIYFLSLIVSLIRSSTFLLFTPTSFSSGDNPVALTLTISAISPTRTLPTPTTETPTGTSPSAVESPGTLGLGLTFGTLLVGVLFGLATVYSRGRKPTNSNCPPPRRNPRRGPSSAPTPPPAPDPTENDETNDGTDNGDSDPGSFGNQDPGDDDGDGDNINDIIDEQEADMSQSEELLRDEHDPEDPPPPPPTTLNENDDDPRATLSGPVLSLLHFLLGAAAGLLTKLVTTNATKYRQELQRLFRTITSRLISVQMGSSKLSLSGPSTVETPCSCRHQPFVVATAPHRSSSRPRRIKVSLPAPFAKIISKYILDTVTRISRTCTYLVDYIRPPVKWLILAMARDLVVVEAYISFAIDWIRAVDAEYGSAWRLIAGYTVLVLVVLEVYYAGLPCRLVNASNVVIAAAYGDEITLPFADVDLPLEDAEFLQLDTVHIDPTHRSDALFPFRDVDLPLVEVNPDNQDSIANVESINAAFTINEINVSLIDRSIEEALADCSVASSSDSTAVEQVEILEASQDDHEANNTVIGSIPVMTPDQHTSSNADAHVLVTENVQFIVAKTPGGEDSHNGASAKEDSEDVQSEEIGERTPGSKDSHTKDEASIGEDSDTVLECLAGLFDSLFTDQSSSEEKCTSASVLAAENVQYEEIASEMPSGQDSHTEDEASAEEDPDTILECLAGFLDLSLIQSSFEEESTSGSLDSPHRVSGGVCVRAFTSCEVFAAMFGFENEKPLEFLRPIPARLERLLPPYYIFPNTPARYFTLGAPPATPTTPYSRWIKEHQTTPFIPSPFGPPRTPPHTPPTIVIPSPTSSEGTQAPDESPAAIRARRLDRKWAKMMAKRQRNEAKNLVPRIRIEETSFSSSIASDSSIRSFFDPHASINRGIRDAETEVGPNKPTKWKPRSPGDPVPKQRRRWRNKDVLVGAGEDKSYGAIGVAVD